MNIKEKKFTMGNDITLALTLLSWGFTLRAWEIFALSFFIGVYTDSRKVIDISFDIAIFIVCILTPLTIILLIIRWIFSVIHSKPHPEWLIGNMLMTVSFGCASVLFVIIAFTLEIMTAMSYCQ